MDADGGRPFQAAAPPTDTALLFAKLLGEGADEAMQILSAALQAARTGDSLSTADQDAINIAMQQHLAAREAASATAATTQPSPSGIPTPPTPTPSPPTASPGATPTPAPTTPADKSGKKDARTTNHNPKGTQVKGPLGLGGAGSRPAGVSKKELRRRASGGGGRG